MEFYLKSAYALGMALKGYKMYKDQIEKAKEHFGALLEKQLKRVENIKAEADFVDYASLDKIVIGVVGGDGIGPFITAHAAHVLEFLLLVISLNGRNHFFVNKIRSYYKQCRVGYF